MTGTLKSNNVAAWIKENEQEFLPPVCNKCMFSNQLKVFFVGGPNQRQDYHIEEGDEIFYQLKGDMCLKVVEKGRKKDVIIKQDEIFLLPAKILHSPQRFENTVGCVVERNRAPFELDGLRYLVDGSTEPLYERFFHLNDVVKDLPPLMKGFLDSDAHKTGKPTADSVVVANRPYEPDDQTELDQPVNVTEWIRTNLADIQTNGWAKIFDNAKYEADVRMYGQGKHTIESSNGDTVLIQLKGSSEIEFKGDLIAMEQGVMTCVPENTNFKLRMNDVDAFCLVSRMPAPATQKNK